MSGGNPQIIYLDSCVIITHVSGEIRPLQEERDGVAKLIEDYNNHLHHIMTSALAIVEIIVDAPARTQFQLLRGHRDFHLYEIGTPVLDLSLEIREYYKNLQDGFRTFTTPDAIHLATAIIYEADIFYTFDGSTPSSNRSGRKILGTPSPIAGKYPLKIDRPWYVPPPPEVPEPTLFLI